MCGICGIMNLDGRPVDAANLDLMTHSIRHRGPDGKGSFIDQGVGLGHRRLSIIDVDGGAQPIANEDGCVHVVFNGEIYNYIELRAELKARGHRFKTHSDTEVIVHAYEQWAKNCVQHFNGMFAFALWDAKKRELFLARDHLGVKPLYHTQIGTTFLFASEIKALLRYPHTPKAVDFDSLAELLTFRYVPSPKTLYQGISKVPPGHHLGVTRQGVKVERFWTCIPQPRTRWREPDLIAEYQALLEDAVRLQMRSDVPLGLFLSSGVDSGGLLAIMRRHASGPVQAFTIGFEGGERTNEVEDAGETARRFGADHYSRIVGPDDYAKYFDRYMVDVEEPVGHEAAPAFYFVSRLAREHVKVALTGQGADEPWAGYGRCIGIKLSDVYSRMPRLVTKTLSRVAASIPGRLERFKRGAASLSEPDMLTRLAKVYSFFNADMKAHLFQGEIRRLFETDPYATRHALARLQSDVQHLDPLTQLLYVDTRASLPDDLLMVGDKTSMANSLELRVPLLDYRLVEFIESLPPQLKLKGFTGKYLHKKALTKWLPPEMVYRKKKGFDNPLGTWMRTRMMGYVDDCLLDPRSFVCQCFNRDYMRRIIAMDRSGREPYRRHIYLLLSIEMWHRSCIRA